MLITTGSAFMVSVVLASYVSVLAVGEQRLKAAVLSSAGLPSNRGLFLPETDPLNFLPRFRMPTLMINGRSDFGCPVETCQIPMLRLLGAREQDKKLVHWDGGHFPTDIRIQGNPRLVRPLSRPGKIEGKVLSLQTGWHQRAINSHPLLAISNAPLSGLSISMPEDVVVCFLPPFKILDQHLVVSRLNFTCFGILWKIGDVPHVSGFEVGLK